VRIVTLKNASGLATMEPAHRHISYTQERCVACRKQHVTAAARHALEQTLPRVGGLPTSSSTAKLCRQACADQGPDDINT